LNFSLYCRQPVRFAIREFATGQPDVGIRNPFEWGAPSLESRIFSGDFHTSPKKLAFFQPFLRFFLAFCDDLGYSPLRPEFFR
jgi:hypothetical protein